MPEPPAWRYQKVIKPIFDIPSPHRILVGGRILTCVGDEVIENGFVEILDGKIKAIGAVADLGDTDATVIDCSGLTLMPGIIQSHAHLAWDGVHDLARQSMDDAPEISAYKAAANMLKSLRAGITLVRDLGMNQANFFTKQAVTQGIFPGPRVLITGEAIIQTGGAYLLVLSRGDVARTKCGVLCANKCVGGADLIKIYGVPRYPRIYG